MPVDIADRDMVIIAFGSENCGPALRGQPGGDPPYAALFEAPVRIQRVARGPVRLRRNAIVARERYLISNVRYRNDMPIGAAPAMKIDTGRLFIGYRWRGREWACLLRQGVSEPKNAELRTGICLRDDDGDGLMDRSSLGSDEEQIAPVRLVRQRPETKPSQLTTYVSLSVLVTAVRRRSIKLGGEIAIEPGLSLPNWNIGNFTLSDPEQRLALKRGRRVTMHGVTIRVDRSNTQWVARSRGTFAGQIGLCPGQMAVRLGGGNLALAASTRPSQ